MKVKIDTAKLDAIVANLHPGTARIVNTYGTAMAGKAGMNAPVDTGALRNSIPAESHMSGSAKYTIQDGVEYGVYQELGTSRMAAQPFLVPAIESLANAFLNAFAGLFK